MKNDVAIKNGIVIPEHELEITTSRAGGPGGQHVNKTDTKVIIRWNIHNTTALSEEQKKRVLENLQAKLTSEGELVVTNNESRSQLHNKKSALDQFAQILHKALYVPKKRMKTRIPKEAKEKRLQEKSRRSTVKKMRRIQNDH